MTRQPIEHDAIVIAVGISLHDHAVGEAEMIEQREVALDRRLAVAAVGTAVARRIRRV
jgi:hypothetical protein